MITESDNITSWLLNDFSSRRGSCCKGTPPSSRDTGNGFFTRTTLVQTASVDHLVGQRPTHRAVCGEGGGVVHSAVRKVVFVNKINSLADHVYVLPYPHSLTWQNFSTASSLNRGVFWARFKKALTSRSSSQSRSRGRFPFNKSNPYDNGSPQYFKYVQRLLGGMGLQ